MWATEAWGVQAPGKGLGPVRAAYLQAQQDREER